jgi:putative polyhydroxyalkanoate system protein
MATIDIRRSHQLEPGTLRERAEGLARELESKLGIVWRWEGDAIRFDAPGGKAKGTQGAVRVSPSEVRVEIDLPLLLRPLKGMVSGKVHTRLDELVR